MRFLREASEKCCVKLSSQVRLLGMLLKSPAKSVYATVVDG